MTSTGDPFRKPSIPTPSTKRKIEDPTSTASYKAQSSNKSAKLANGTSPHHSYTNGLVKHASSPSSGRVATVEEEEDLEASTSLPPTEDIEDDIGDDDEGRFFGSGVSKSEREVLDFIDQNEGEEVEADEVYDTAWLRKAALRFRKKIDKNSEMRGRYPEEPQKFVGSEADLDDEIKGLSILAEHTDLYGEFARLKGGDGGVRDLVGLLSHENTDIAVRAVEVMGELTDEDTGAEEGDWSSLVEGMVKAGAVELLVQNFGRLDEEGNESDRDGVYHVLELVENLCSDVKNVERVGRENGMLEWLVRRVKRADAEARGRVSQNRQYVAEVLAILLQGSAKNRDEFVKLEGVDVLLELLSPYRKRDPEKDSDEEEFVENLFDCLTCLVDDLDGGDKFVEGEGVELCLIMLREGKMSKSRSLRVLDHAMSGKNGIAVCEKVVDAAGLKTIFGLLMRSKKPERELVEHLIGIFASLLRYLPAESAPRIRTLAKFVEKEYQKIERLVEVRKEYADRVTRVEKEIQQEKNGLSTEEQEDMEAEWLSRRLDAGLFALQTVDVILAWLVAEDDGARRKIAQMLQESADGLNTLQRSLREQLDGIDSEEGHDSKEMLEALLRCLPAS
jgi:beta-catenin-like protein 1